MEKNIYLRIMLHLDEQRGQRSKNSNLEQIILNSPLAVIQKVIQTDPIWITKI